MKPSKLFRSLQKTDVEENMLPFSARKAEMCLNRRGIGRKYLIMGKGSFWSDS